MVIILQIAWKREIIQDPTTTIIEDSTTTSLTIEEQVMIEEKEMIEEKGMIEEEEILQMTTMKPIGLKRSQGTPSMKAM